LCFYLVSQFQLFIVCRGRLSFSIVLFKLSQCFQIKSSHRSLLFFLIKEGHQVGTLLWLLNDFAISVY